MPMKKIIPFIPVVLLVALFILPSSAQNRITGTTIYVTNNSTTVPTNLTAGVSATTNIFARRVTIIGKASPRSANTSTAYIGFTSGNDTQPYPVLSGGEVVLRIPDNETINLANIWVDVGTAGDGVTIIYFP